MVLSGLLLNVIIRKRMAIFKLLASENEMLLIGLIGWDALCVLSICLCIVNCVKRVYLKSGHFSSESLDEDLHVRILALTLLVASEDSMITLPIKIFDKDLHASMQMQDDSEVKG